MHLSLLFQQRSGHHFTFFFYSHHNCHNFWAKKNLLNKVLQCLLSRDEDRSFPKIFITVLIGFHCSSEFMLDYYKHNDGSFCGCGSKPSCHMSAGFYDDPSYSFCSGFDQIAFLSRDLIDDSKIRCSPMESLLLSSRQTFYNQTSFKRTLIDINSSLSLDRFTALVHISKRSNFSSTTTLNILVKKLFVEDFVQTLNYSSYYSQCQPQFCHYITNHRSHPLDIIDSLLSLYGALSIVLHFIIPHLLDFLLQRIERRAPVSDRVSGWITNLWNTLVNFNLYRNALSLELHHVTHHSSSTRLYLPLLSLAFTILTLYLSLSVAVRVSFNSLAFWSNRIDIDQFINVNVLFSWKIN